jgi:pyruvate/2-oxoglutarate dehydrogenase complex dihydrolipoamide acyltransferase (E2) component
MPFWYQVPIPALDDPQPVNVRLVEWLVGVGDEVHRGTKMAVIEAPTGRYVVIANGDGVFREQHFPAGAEIESTTPIGVIATDGENIPYGRPYSLAERLGESG